LKEQRGRVFAGACAFPAHDSAIEMTGFEIGSLRAHGGGVVRCIADLHIVAAISGVSVDTEADHEISKDSGLSAIGEIAMNIFGGDISCAWIEDRREHTVTGVALASEGRLTPGRQRSAGGTCRRVVSCQGLERNDGK